MFLTSLDTSSAGQNGDFNVVPLKRLFHMSAVHIARYHCKSWLCTVQDDVNRNNQKYIFEDEQKDDTHVHNTSGSSSGCFG